ncbi:methyltransferase domain-containing protein [Aestuariivirga litoralis]|uniref:methyltransferase domain-containing protein n=1 Tax=Aestuariivirga litoralis TaxID=2650924 RepID=UPI0018C502DF|nr:class I SAM-dependent methyltransferase [Aestuariivirga litoralis]
MIEVNSQYNVAKAGSLPVRLASYQRRRMYDVFLADMGLPDESATLLDVGATSDRSYATSNYVEAWYPHKHRITACGVDDAGFLTVLYPGMTFKHADATRLPFADQSFDVVHSSAVLEHVGSFENQVRMMAECARVCRRGFFITTPNRWFPVEFHTVLPFVHWLPKPAFRNLMRKTGRGFFAEESNLNLMGGAELRRAATLAGIEGQLNVTLSSVSLLGWPSNLLLAGKVR